MIGRGLAFLVIALLVINISAPVYGSSAPSIEDRIRAAISFVIGQYVSDPNVAGFARGTAGPTETGRIYSGDNGIVALALASYLATHNSDEFYSHLKVAVDFILRSQTSSRDFYEYYDLSNQSWRFSGGLYDWDAFALMGAAYAAYEVTDHFPAEKTYWAGVVDKLRMLVEYWVPQKQLVAEGIVFSSAGAPPQTNVAANGAMLVALIHIALFEHHWGDVALATRYANWSQGIALWLYSLQERNETSWGRGGFYTNSSQKLQLAFENGLAMLGLNSYYKAVGVLLPNFTPSISELRQSMIDWTEGFVENMLDAWGGPKFGRGITELTPYPKTTLSAASLSQALVDVWINIGFPEYWSDASRIYSWIAGSNERSMDLQQAKSIHGAAGGFYSGIQETGIITDADLPTAALTLYAIVKAAWIRVLEFPSYPIAMMLSAIFAALVVIRLRAKEVAAKIDA